MKNILNKKYWSLPVLLGLLICTMGLVSCEDSNDSSDSPMNITAVYLEDARSPVPDRKVEYARLGQTLRLEGSGFSGVQKIYINGRSTYFNATFVTDKNIIVQISKETPTMEAKPEVRNKIILEKNGKPYEYEFDIRAAAPTITNISHTLPRAGEEITLYGTGLAGATKVVFPGNIPVTDGLISDDETGKYCIVTVPPGVSESGAVYIECANGGAYSSSYFNYKQGILQDFDNVSTYEWSNGEVSDDLSATIPATGGSLPKSQGIYRSFNKGNKEMPVSDNPVDLSRFWMKNLTWGSIINAAGIPVSTSTSECAFQMDIYYEGVWNSGNIRFVAVDGKGASHFCMIYAPWAVGGNRVVVENPGCWYTVTFPLGDSEDMKTLTLDGVLVLMAADPNNQSGPWFENGNIDGAASQPTNLNVYFDNIRIVPLAKPAYSDYPDDEE